MDWIKNTPLCDVKADFSGFHGFAFISPHKSKDRSLESLAANIRNAGITKDWPLLATHFDGGFLFVYKEMNAPEFWQKADFFNTMGMAKVIPLIHFLNSIPNDAN